MHNLNLNHLFKSHISRTYLAQNIDVLCLIFAFISGLLGTAFSVLIRIELSVHGVQYIADNQLYNAVITAHAILMIFFMVMPALIGGFGNKILLPFLIILCFCFFILSISFLVPEYFAGDNVNLSSSNLPPLRSLGLLSERHPSKSLSDWIIEESSRILAERGKGVDPSVLQSQTYYKSVTLGDLNLKYHSVDGDIIKRVTEEYLSSKNWTLDNKIPLDRLCSSLNKVRGSNWQTNVVYSDSLGSSSIKHSFVELLRTHNN